MRPDRSSPSARRRSVSLPCAIHAVVLSAAALLVLAGPVAPSVRSAFVTGTVKSVDGQPLAGVEVTLSRETDGEPLVATDTTDESGRYAFKVGQEYSGQFLLQFEAEGYEPVESLVEPAWGRVRTVDVDLLPWEQAIREHPDTAVKAGFDAFDQGKLEEAVTYFEAALAADPDRAAAHRGLAEVHLRGGRPAEAADEVEVYLERHPGDTEGLRLAYEVYDALDDEEGLERTKDALVAAGAGAEIAPTVYNRGVEASEAGDHEEASARFREALELDPELAEASVALASIAYSQGRFDAAARRAGDALRAEPDDAEAARLRFLALEAAGAPGVDEALAGWIDRAPRVAVRSVLERAEEEIDTERLDRAEERLLRLLAVRPDQPEAHALLGVVYYEARETEPAEEHLQRFLELAPDHPDAQTARAMLEDLQRPTPW